MLNDVVIGIPKKRTDLLRAFIVRSIDETMQCLCRAILVIDEIKESQSHHDLALHYARIAAPHSSINPLGYSLSKRIDNAQEGLERAVSSGNGLRADVWS